MYYGRLVLGDEVAEGVYRARDLQAVTGEDERSLSRVEDLGRLADGLGVDLRLWIVCAGRERGSLS